MLADDLEHGLAGLGRDVGPVVQDARDGRDRDAGEVGDVADRRAAAERRLGLSGSAWAIERYIKHPETVPAIPGRHFDQVVSVNVNTA